MRVAIGLAFGLLVAEPALAGTAAAQPATEGTAARAKAAVAAGREAANAGDFAGALEHFERALSLRPAASLHFNIAVCHHNLMLAAEPGSEAYDTERRAAIEAYGRYLDASPDAEDRKSVEATIDELGGPSRGLSSEPWVIERIDPGDVPVAPGLREATESEPALPGPARPPDEPPREPSPSPGADLPVARIGPFIPVSLASLVELSRSDTAVGASGLPAMRPVPGVGLGVRGSGLLGARHRIAVGGELWATGQPISSRGRPVLVSGVLSATVEYARPFADGRLEVGAGGGLGIMLQTLRYTGDSPPPCSVADTGAISTRPGALLFGRFVLAALLGPKRNHELALRISPSLGALGPGSKRKMDASDPAAQACESVGSPFETLGLSSRAALVVMIDLGYAPRF